MQTIISGFDLFFAILWSQRFGVVHISCMSCVSSENLALPYGKFTVDAMRYQDLLLLDPGLNGKVPGKDKTGNRRHYDMIMINPITPRSE